ncbi:efflux RND transporter periplasmic adaptor subunit [Alteromonas sp. C1M14]|uniref:efflux RND transporter periplasmic adaptor subunit n=1 Tax=Alteromonas sp. C1M14 TaxID=2841567 RepID=UPI001C088E6C|nr:efflux RND transporter periplasmic adaptor subunit [Alteromonas sp. C1M14]MBU2979388.1 efflux RND transporter periplasmic adaptor subunit [Alteromonas sp. C1M14]
MKNILKTALFVGVTVYLTACGSNEVNPEKMMTSSAATAAIPVDVAPVIHTTISQWDSFTGRLEAVETVSLRPRVSGYIDFVAFDEGQWVEQGQTLFLIDNRGFKAEVARLTAQLDEAKSRLKLAKLDAERAASLQRTQAISNEVADTRIAGVEQAKANVAATQAALQLAQLNRGFARVQAPISGRISRANITTGNYVTAGQSVLTSIVSTQRLYAYFDIDESTYLGYTQDKNFEQLRQLPVAMQLANGTTYDHWGQLDFVDNQVNPDTGTIKVRAAFDNQSGDLVPGLFAHLRLASGVSKERILIDETAVGTDLNNKYVLVVGEDNTLSYRAVSLGDKVGSLRFIDEGLSPNETVVVNGLQRVRPGASVAPNVVSMEESDALKQLQVWQRYIDSNGALTAALPPLTLPQGQR